MLAESGIVRNDIRSSFGSASGTAEGVPMTLELTLTDIAGGGKPFAGAAVYVWHCTREGEYSLYSPNVQNENFLRGVQVADATGKVRFTSVFPGLLLRSLAARPLRGLPRPGGHRRRGQADRHLAGRAAPARLRNRVRHGRLRLGGNLGRVSLAGDNVFGDDGGVHQLATAPATSRGLQGGPTVPVDTITAPDRRRTGRAPAEPLISRPAASAPPVPAGCPRPRATSCAEDPTGPAPGVSASSFSSMGTRRYRWPSTTSPGCTPFAVRNGFSRAATDMIRWTRAHAVHARRSACAACWCPPGRADRGSSAEPGNVVESSRPVRSGAPERRPR